LVPSEWLHWYVVAPLALISVLLPLQIEVEVAEAVTEIAATSTVPVCEYGHPITVRV